MNPKADRDISKDINLLTFNIPVHVPNMESAEVESTRLLRFSVRAGGKDLWQTSHEVTIDEYASPPDSTGIPTPAGTCRQLICQFFIVHVVEIVQETRVYRDFHYMRQTPNRAGPLLRDGTPLAELLNDVPNVDGDGGHPTLMPGNAAVYRAQVSVPPGWSDFKIQLAEIVEQNGMYPK